MLVASNKLLTNVSARLLVTKLSTTSWTPHVAQELREAKKKLSRELQAAQRSLTKSEQEAPALRVGDDVGCWLLGGCWLVGGCWVVGPWWLLVGTWWVLRIVRLFWFAASLGCCRCWLLGHLALFDWDLLSWSLAFRSFSSALSDNVRGVDSTHSHQRIRAAPGFVNLTAMST